jgi:hypothetical protein
MVDQTLHKGLHKEQARIKFGEAYFQRTKDRQVVLGDTVPRYRSIWLLERVRCVSRRLQAHKALRSVYSSAIGRAALASATLSPPGTCTSARCLSGPRVAELQKQQPGNLQFAVTPA